MEEYGGVEVTLHKFWISTLGGDEWPDSLRVEQVDVEAVLHICIREGLG
jgi:hypothetical protein